MIARVRGEIAAPIASRSRPNVGGTNLTPSPVGVAGDEVACAGLAGPLRPCGRREEVDDGPEPRDHRLHTPCDGSAHDLSPASRNVSSLNDSRKKSSPKAASMPST